MNLTKDSERRRHRRMPFKKPVCSISERKGAASLSFSADLSPGGLFVATETPGEIGEVVRISFQPGEDSDAIECRGKVVWNRRRGKNGKCPSGMGIQFLDEAGKVGATVERILSQSKKESRISELLEDDSFNMLIHTFKAPIVSVSGYSSILLEENMPADQRECVQNINHCAHILMMMANNILDAKRIERGRLVILPTDFSISKSIADIIKIFLPVARAKRIDLAPDVKVDYQVRADRDKIRDVLINLVNNAIEATQAGGVVISARKITENKIEVSVGDSGCGIPCEKLPHLFKRYSHVSQKRRGMGLGVYIAREIIEAHEEELRVESVEGVGTKFSFTLKEKK